MPPRKRALAEKPANTQPPARTRKVAAKKTGKGKGNESLKDVEGSKENPVNVGGEERESAEIETANETASETGDDAKEDFKNRLPHVYYCINRPRFDFENENEEKPKGERLDEDKLWDKFMELHDNDIIRKAAADHPDHKWVAMWDSWRILCDWQRLASYTDPDNFKMYIFNDWHGYGIQELIENLLEAFNKEVRKKDRDEAILQMWAIMAGMIHWFKVDSFVPWTMLEDGERMCKTVHLIGVAFLEILHELDHAGFLAPNSPIKDLSLVISMYLAWAQAFEDIGVDDEEDLMWRKHVISYVKKAGIDLVKDGCYGTSKVLQSYEERYPRIPILKDVKGKTRWKWQKYYREFRDEYHGPWGEIGGEEFNILKLNRSERAKKAFDGKDPLADVSDKDLEEGNLFFN